MNSIFFRVYGGILAVLITVLLLGLAAIWLVNDIRTEEYRERIATGTFRLMADNLENMDHAERLRALAAWTRLIGVPLEMKHVDELDLETSAWSRLTKGRVLVRPSRNPRLQVHALVNQAEGVVLTAAIHRVSEQLGRATLFLVADELVRYPEGDMPGRLQQLRGDKGFGYPLRLTPAREADLDPDQRRRLEESDTVMTLGPDGDSVLLYLKIPDSQWILSLGPLYQMNEYPAGLLLITGMLMLALCGLLIYLLVRQLERRLLTLESAAAHITAGNLNARVDARGNDAVGRLARAFNRMATHLQRLMRIQQEMIGAVSHELRTPVARLRFGLEMVDTAVRPEDRRKYVEGMDADLNELDGLVDEILVYARLDQDAPELTFKRTNVPAMVDQIVSELAPLNQQLEVRHDDHSMGRALHVEAESRYLQRAVANLVTNAMRYAKSRVLVTTQVQYERCIIMVEDDGPGIDEDFRERIFTPFLRLDDSRTRSSGGYGLGLAIVRRIIYWHQGSARVERSTTLDGAAFILDWPLRRS
ncbi:HAMP domain-containing protein [Pseudomonas sp. gcc21]|uniref:ATP-binding protein n=1 Tax=Pseudomonas sp. gcc21 TaxID=2726989 RepID=UPI001451411D|nr:ATP-binding protein [Pseudomonas sp. gcc21]QJD57867.1 HAMP domain-containing protein [Pseudomonas sp. gcc21]